MQNEWPLVRIGDIQADKKGAIAIGPFGSRLRSDNYVESGIPVIRGTNISGGPSFEGDFVYITEEKADTLGSSNVYRDDLVFPHRGSIGEVGIIQEDSRFVLSSSLMKLTCDKTKVNPKFLYYFFKTHLGKYELLKNASQVGTPGIGQPLSSLKAIEFRKPPLPVQDKIEELITSLDNKIQLNRQTNQTLEKMAQALFKSWFVDFDPVIDNALAAGNTIPEPLQKRAEQRQALRAGDDAPAPLPEAIRQLFPASFVFDAEMGWIPEGWEVISSGDVIDVRDGTHDSPKQAKEGFPLVTSKHITTGVLRLEDTYLISKDDFDKVNQRSKVEEGDILLTMIGTVGIPYLVMQKEVNFAIKNIGLFRTSQAPVFKNYFYYLLKSQGMQHYLEARKAGTTQKYLSLKVLRNLEFINPGEPLLEAFNRYVEGLLNKKYHSTIQNEALSKTRDTLLPKLISGELRIPEAQQQTEAVVA